MRKSYIFTMLFALLSSGAVAQTAPSHTKYVSAGSSKVEWNAAYRALTESQIGKKALYEGLDEEAAENENFFISRVKPRERFIFTKTQVKESLNPNRKLLWWCPINVADWNAVPNYFFGSEVFSMWSYTDIYGNWTAPFVQIPGAFTDVCHKNGVVTSPVASVAWASTVTKTGDGHGRNFAAMIDGKGTKFLKYLRYYGIDGIGFNSEFTFSPASFATEMKGLLNDAFKNKDAMNWPTMHNCWYSLMTSGGSLGGGLDLNSSNKDWFNYNGYPTSNAYFMNYGFSSGTLSGSQSTARTFPGRSSFDVYAGINFQGGGSENWKDLVSYDISLGLWGAHNMNMMYENRGENGSGLAQSQRTYQLISENTFTGSSYNPVNTPAISSNTFHTSKATTFHGFSSFIVERSSLTCSDLAKDPFVTYFNMGNGHFFNVEGLTTFNNQWYNIGMQDYLPTWRWWWTSNFMGKSASDVTKELTAEFTWDDAWFGGSCLQISGKTDAAYLQLFKTKYKTATTGDYITIRYKVISGTGSLAWACSTEDAPTVEVAATIKNNAALTDDWQEIRTSIGSGRSALKVHNATLALIGLKFTNTSSDFKILIGEMSLTRGTSPTPAAPVVTKSKVLARNYKGVDLKVIFNMAYTPESSEVPVYNSDVNTWYFKVYTQQEGSSQIMCTATTSWASYVVAAPYDVKAGGKVRIGVSAVSLDGKSESTITWGDWLTVPSPTIVEGFSLDKSIIKANEDFTVSFNDPNHPAAEWQVKSSTDDAVKYSGNVHDFTISLPDEGLYDLYLTLNGKTEVYRGMIQISPKEVGAMPKITKLTANDQDDNISIKKGDEVEFKYVGRTDVETDGKVSRGVALGGNGFGFSMSQIPGISNRALFSVSFWLYVSSLTPDIEGTTLLQLRYCKDGWPANNWGYMWCDINADNQFHLCIQNGGDPYKPGFEFKPGSWYHIAYVFDFSSQRDIHAYINGKYMGKKSASAPAWKSENQLLVGGKAANRSSLDGYIDEFQFYDKAISADDVKASMQHQPTAPAGLIGYWDFETDPRADHTILSTGTNKSLIAGIYEVIMLSEKESDFRPQPFSFAPGAPFIAGDVYKVTTTPKWTYKGATVVESAGDGKSGHSKVFYQNEGNYSANLTLENSWGSDSKPINFISVTTGIEDVTLEEMMAFPNPFEDEVYVRFANEGSYTVDIFDNAGRQISSRNASVDAGEMMNISVNGASGIYFIKISKEGTLFKAIKVIKK